MGEKETNVMKNKMEYNYCGVKSSLVFACFLYSIRQVGSEIVYIIERTFQSQRLKQMLAISTSGMHTS